MTLTLINVQLGVKKSSWNSATNRVSSGKKSRPAKMEIELQDSFTQVLKLELDEEWRRSNVKFKNLQQEIAALQHNETVAECRELVGIFCYHLFDKLSDSLPISSTMNQCLQSHFNPTRKKKKEF